MSETPEPLVKYCTVDHPYNDSCVGDLMEDTHGCVYLADDIDPILEEAQETLESLMVFLPDIGKLSKVDALLTRLRARKEG